MTQRQRISHSIPPTYDGRSRVLVLGTMPSPASRELGFNYGHPRNRFWPVLAALAGEPVPATNGRKRDFCLRHHIALWDVLAECEIEGAADASIRNARPNRLTDITRAAPIEAVYCTGAKSHELYRRLCEAEVGLPAVKLPSTSPANAACSMERLLAAYAPLFQHEHAFEPPALDVPQVVALEQDIAAAGTPLSELMDRAGTYLAWRVQTLLSEAVGQQGTSEGKPSVAILCGNGNNGGDGWVAARLLAQAGVPVRVIYARAPKQLEAQPARDAALAAWDALTAGGAVLIGPDDDALSAIAQASIVVDAILGTGVKALEPREPFRSWIQAVNHHRDQGGCLVVAADVPSGVSAHDGSEAQAHIRADETVTMMTRKPGLSSPACGQVRIAPLVYLEPFL